MIREIKKFRVFGHISDTDILGAIGVAYKENCIVNLEWFSKGRYWVDSEITPESTLEDFKRRMGGHF